MHKFLLFIILFLVANNALSQWTQTMGPEGCTANCLARVDTTIFCGTIQGIYFSNDNGITWQDYTLFPPVFINSIYAQGDTMIVLYRSGYINWSADSIFSLTTFDAGQTWSNPVLISASGFVNPMHSFSGRIITNNDSGILWTDDYGQSWNSMNPFGSFFWGVQYNGNYLLAGRSYGSSINYYISSADSLDFIQIDSLNYSINEVIIDSLLFGYRINSPSFYDIIKSDDYGQTWSTIAVTDSFPGFQLLASDSILFYRDHTGIYHMSNDYGSNWNTGPIPHSYDYPQLVPITGGDEIAIKNMTFTLGHYLSASDSSYELYNGIRGTTINLLTSTNNAIYAVTNNEDIFKSNNNGNTWQRKGHLWQPVDQLLIFGDTLLTVDFDFFRSDDDGFTWNVLSAPASNFIASKGHRIYAAGSLIFYSDDLGLTWSQIANASTSSCGSSSPAGSMCVLGNNLFSVSYNGVVWKLDQNDSSWTNCFCIPNLSSSTTPFPIIQNLNNVLVITCESGIFVSYDAGNTWIPSANRGLYTNLQSDTIYPGSIVAIGGDWIGTSENYGILYTSNSGNDWFPLMQNVTPFYPKSLTIYNNQLFAGSMGRGVWTTNLVLKTPILENNKIKIYPNPTKDYLNLNLKNISNGPYLVKIYDVLGKELKEVISQGVITKISIAGLPDGFYFGQIFEVNNSIKLGFKFIVKGN